MKEIKKGDYVNADKSPLVIPKGLEPPTSWAVTRYSIQLSYEIFVVHFLKCGANIGKKNLFKQCVK